MPRGRHHTVPRFIIERFARSTQSGARVCQLEKTSGRTSQISPRAATVFRHFYSVETDEGRDPAVENALAKVESATAPTIAKLTELDPSGLAQRPEISLAEQAELALFISLARGRTPIAREQTKSIAEQLETYRWTEKLRQRPDDLRKAFAGAEWDTLTDEEIERRRSDLLEGLEGGTIAIEAPVNLLIQTFLSVCGYHAWVLCLLDWTFVRATSVPFILGDTPVSVVDPTPMYPGSAAGVISSPNAELFIAVDPRVGILTKPNAAKLKACWDAASAMQEMTDEERMAHVAEHGGAVGEAIVSDDFVRELNLRTYAHAQRFVYGTQEAVCATHKAAKADPVRLARWTPAPPRFHIVEDDPDHPGLLRELRVFEAPTQSARASGKGTKEPASFGLTPSFRSHGAAGASRRRAPGRSDRRL